MSDDEYIHMMTMENRAHSQFNPWGFLTLFIIAASASAMIWAASTAVHFLISLV